VVWNVGELGGDENFGGFEAGEWIFDCDDLGSSWVREGTELATFDEDCSACGNVNGESYNDAEPGGDVAKAHAQNSPVGINPTPAVVNLGVSIARMGCQRSEITYRVAGP